MPEPTHDLFSDLRDHLERGRPTRRRFLQGAAITAGATAVLPSWLASAAAGGTPIGSDEGIVVLVQLNGGNDGLNTVVPRSGTMRSQYEAARGNLKLAAGSLLPIDAAWGYHPKLPKLAARHAAGKVVAVQGIGTELADLSHFNCAATVGAGTASGLKSTGWLGRYLDGTSAWSDGLAGVAVATVVPLPLVGQRAKVAAVPSTSGPLWGPASTSPIDKVLQETLRSFADGDTGLGPWGDKLAQKNVDALDAAVPVNALRSVALPTNAIARDLTLAARAINADFGARVVSVSIQGWDTHALQLGTHASMLGQLDDGIDAFFSALDPAFASRVTMVVLSEFGRRVAANGSQGTDHGRAGTAFVIGDNVRGGLTGQAPALDALDPNGDLVPSVDFRSLYATVLSQWLAADDQEILGAQYSQLDLFAAAPGATRPAAAA